MTDFTRLMMMDGVTPLNSKPAAASASRKPPLPPRPTPAGASKSASAAPKADSPSGEAWATKDRAKDVLTTALLRLQAEHRDGKTGWIKAIRQDGETERLSVQASAAEILLNGDSRNWRLVLIAGDGWTCILHPKAGAATIEIDP